MVYQGVFFGHSFRKYVTSFEKEAKLIGVMRVEMMVMR